MGTMVEATMDVLRGEIKRRGDGKGWDVATGVECLRTEVSTVKSCLGGCGRVERESGMEGIREEANREIGFDDDTTT